MPTLPKNRLATMKRTAAKPAPHKMEKFIENPAHTQTSMLLQSQFEETGPANQTIAFGRSISKLRESRLTEEKIPTEENDGLPLLSVPAETRLVTDGLQAHAPPSAPEGKMYVLEPEKFAYGFVEPPKYRLVKDLGVPKNAYLLSPAERQQRMLQGKLKDDAKRQLHGDNAKEVRLVEQMRNAFPRGALGSEAPVTEGSDVYASSIQQIDDKAWKKYAVAEARHGDLLNNLSRVQYTKYDPIKDGEAAGPYQAQDKFFQGKGRIQERDSFRQSTKSHDLRGVNENRTQQIRNVLTKGRPFDIISGVGYEYVAPSVPETLEARHMRSTHPSLNSRAGNL